MNERHSLAPFLQNLCYTFSINQSCPGALKHHKNAVKECVFVATFIIGLVILFGGAALYGRFCEKVFGPDDRQTPAYANRIMHTHD